MDSDLHKKLSEYMSSSYVGNKKFCFDCKNMNVDGYCIKGKTPIVYFGVKTKINCKYKNFENKSEFNNESKQNK